MPFCYMPRLTILKDTTHATNDTEVEMSDPEFPRLRALPTPIFKMPLRWRDFQPCENTASSSPSSEASDSQVIPLTCF